MVRGRPKKKKVLTEVTEDINLQVLEQLAGSRSGRKWIRENCELWDEQMKLYFSMGEKLQKMVDLARHLLKKHETATEKATVTDETMSTEEEPEPDTKTMNEE